MRTAKMRMKQFYTLGTAFMLSGLLFTACSEEDGPGDVTPIELEAKMVADLDGNKTKTIKDENNKDTVVAVPTYFSLAEGKAVDSASTEWDIQFSGTTLSFGNGSQAQLVEGIFNEYVSLPSSGYSTEPLSGSDSWYNYTGSGTAPEHAILPIPGKIILVKTHDNKYAKIEMISYYKGNPDTSTEEFADYINRDSTSPSRYYTFRYVYQADGSTDF